MTPMNLSMKQKQNDGHSEFGIGRYKLIYIEWTNDKVLPCSTGNGTHYTVIDHNRKEYEK